MRLACIVILIGATLAGCSRPVDHQVLDLCRKSAVIEAQGRGITAADTGELIEACMKQNNYVPRENDARCSNDIKATEPACYYHNDIISRFLTEFF